MSQAPASVQELVARFDRNLESYRNQGYNETQLRREFIDPFFEALGWDVVNKSGKAEAYKDVIHEDAISVGGFMKAPDYCFRIGGTRKFFLEAKKPSINLKEDTHPAYQLRRYAWSAKLPLSILTDFEEFAVYDCRTRPVATDKPATRRTLYLTYRDYLTRWDEIASVFSKDAIEKGSFDKYAVSERKRGTATVDEEFLAEIERWREALAKTLAVRNPKLSVHDLNFAVQRTIDRIIFLRICEDRAVEHYGQLQALLNAENIYGRLKQLYYQADDRYNSGLFHFQPEESRAETPDELTLSLKIDDKVLKDIITGLYPPESPYEFSVFPAEILGQVYEQFLGKVIRLTAGHQAKVEEKPEVKKAGGVYYTPAYIVDYIVKQTVGKLCDGKTPKQIEKLRILDPACGSGSFLIGAYAYLLNYHRDWYVKDGTDKHRKELFQTVGGEWRLTTQEKKRILLNNIYGVDIDSQAVEVTKLSLLLKVLEGESDETLKRQLSFVKERALPDLGSNIKCGNSLIGPDYFTGQLLPDEEAMRRINPFDWQAEFLEIMKAGGFDAVIGNPPWGAEFSDGELAYLREHYQRVIARMVDSYIYFLDRAIQLAKSGTPVGFIIPSTVLNQVDARPIREILLQRGLGALVNLGQDIFGSKVLNTSTICVSTSATQKDAFILKNLSDLPFVDRIAALSNGSPTSWNRWKNLVKDDPHLTFFVGNIRAASLLNRLRREHIPLKKVLRGEIQRGVSPDIAAAHVVSISDARTLRLERDLLRSSVSGGQIKRYKDWRCDQFIIYTTRDTHIDRFPKVARYLKRYRDQNTCREVSEDKHPWWSLHRPRDPSIFESPKFIGLTTSKSIEVIYDNNRSVFVTDAMYVFNILPEYDPYAFMAILHSKLLLFLYHVANQGESRVIPQIKASKLEPLPYPACEPSSPRLKRLRDLYQSMLALRKQLATTKGLDDRIRLQRQIDATDREIDRLVYDLYGLTEEEIRIVEETLAASKPTERDNVDHEDRPADTAQPQGRAGKGFKQEKASGTFSQREPDCR
jgi:transcriptional regulator of met regulon